MEKCHYVWNVRKFLCLKCERKFAKNWSTVVGVEIRYKIWKNERKRGRRRMKEKRLIWTKLEMKKRNLTFLLSWTNRCESLQSYGTATLLLRYIPENSLCSQWLWVPDSSNNLVYDSLSHVTRKKQYNGQRRMTDRRSVRPSRFNAGLRPNVSELYINVIKAFEHCCTSMKLCFVKAIVNENVQKNVNNVTKMLTKTFTWMWTTSQKR